MVFSLQHRIARYPGFRQTTCCLGSIAGSSSHHQVSCIHTTMSSQVFAFVIMHFAAVTSSSSISRWNRYSYLSRRCVLRGSSKGRPQSPTRCCHSIAKLQSFIVNSSSNHDPNAIPVSSQCITTMLPEHRQNITTMLPEHRQNITTVLPPLHHNIIQTIKHIAKLVLEPPPSVSEASSRHRQPVVSVSSIHRQRIFT